MAYVIDTECYPNYWLFAAKNTKSGKTVLVDFQDDGRLDESIILSLMSKHTTIGFNSLSYDLPMIVAAIHGFSTKKLKKLSDRLINSREPAWKIAKEFDLDINTQDYWKHIDLIEVAPGKSSLKLYGGRLGCPVMQDLPFDPDRILSDEEIQKIRSYCGNDLDITHLLFEALKPQLKLRAGMSNQYGMDVRSKSDAQIAEVIIRSELTSLTGKTYSPSKLNGDYSFFYKDPSFLEFESDRLQTLFSRICQEQFTLTDSGSVQLPEWLKKDRIQIGESYYQMGIGGLHSCEQSQHIVASDGTMIVDMDVVSYYPSIILQLGLAPPSLGPAFLSTYKSIVDRRIAAKKKGDKVTADTLKICVNGSFGKLGSRYSFLYAPSLLLQVTLTGQLLLLMLIERMEKAGIKVVSANTDGIVMHCSTSCQKTMREVAWDWQLDTGMELEETEYLSISSRDVNNYLAVKTNGKTKGKGIFAETSLAKNPDGQIVYEAVAQWIAKRTPIEKTIQDCDDITKFCTVRRVEGGAMWNGHYLGKAIRFYASSSTLMGDPIRYKKNGNKVPNSDGTMPLMDIRNADLADVDRQNYIMKARELLKEVGYART